MKRIFPLSYKVNPEKPMSVVLIGLVYVVVLYIIRILFALIPFFKIGFNILSAALTLYVICALTVAILRYIKRV